MRGGHDIEAQGEREGKARSLIYERYFLSSILLYVLVVGLLLDRLYQRGGTSRILFFALMTLYLLGQFSSYLNFIPNGRGQFFQGVSYLAKQSHGKRITVGSDFDFRNEMVINFYKKRIKGGEHIDYIHNKDWHTIAPEYFFLHHLGKRLNPPPEKIVSTVGDREYTHQYLKTFPFGEKFSGWHWYLYRKID